jgi:hypothetical protein
MPTQRDADVPNQRVAEHPLAEDRGVVDYDAMREVE